MNDAAATWHPDDDRTIVRTAPVQSGVTARDDWKHAIVVVHGALAGRRVGVDATPLVIGRREPATLCVPEPEVSSRHCEVQTLPQRDDLVVTDLNSTNGTFVDGRRILGRALWPPGGLLQVGSHMLRHEFLPRELAHAAAEADRDLEKAWRYVQSLLPAPVRNDKVQTDWFFQPSARLGGDAFGYQSLDEHRLAGYLIDVCGHGVGAAMHSVSVLNVLRQRALPGVDFAQPAQVLERLNAMFQMDDHDGLYFSAWYGVYDDRDASLTHSGAGHHPVFVSGIDGAALQPLQVRNPLIGVLPDSRYAQERVAIAPGSRLYAFSDGAFEIVDKQGRERGLADFLPLLAEPAVDGLSEPERLFRRVSGLSRSASLDDDFSVLVVTFLSQAAASL